MPFFHYLSGHFQHTLETSQNLVGSETLPMIATVSIIAAPILLPNTPVHVLGFQRVPGLAPPSLVELHRVAYR